MIAISGRRTSAFGVVLRLGVMLILGLAVMSGCSKPPESVVVGVKEATLHKDKDLKGPGTSMTAGTTLQVLELQDEVVKVSAGEGEQGWIRRCQLCYASEFQKRQADGNVPEGTVCVGHRETGFFVYGGRIAIRNNAVSFEPGQGIWCDKSVAGHNDFTVGGTALTRKPDVLCYITSDAKIVELPILPATEQRR